ncbi:hypothetical protein [Streptomyces sp. NBC_01363]|uniref:hypothetical protein n=1 Tax=Streptomyces sp. NBC_01363 TaxID=2903840 RepID=UPI0022542F8B|nr:hypothetical protein [Streptomyces sp. NBC_01363]MCX4734372.1 hypothetical protein [Streptomyces sp. NBC_01363]
MTTLPPDAAAARSADLRAAASRLVFLDDITETTAPAEVLDNIAATIDAMRHPVVSLGGSDAADRAIADAAAAVCALRNLR